MSFLNFGYFYGTIDGKRVGYALVQFGDSKTAWAIGHSRILWVKPDKLNRYLESIEALNAGTYKASDNSLSNYGWMLRLDNPQLAKDFDQLIHSYEQGSRLRNGPDRMYARGRLDGLVEEQFRVLERLNKGELPREYRKNSVEQVRRAAKQLKEQKLWAYVLAASLKE